MATSNGARISIKAICSELYLFNKSKRAGIIARNYRYRSKVKEFVHMFWEKNHDMLQYICCAMLWYGMEWMVLVCYGISMLCHKIFKLYYVMVYVVKDKHSAILYSIE